MSHLSFQQWGLDGRDYRPQERFFAVLLGLVFFLAGFSIFGYFDAIQVWSWMHVHARYSDISLFFRTSLAMGYGCLTVFSFVAATEYQKQTSLGNLYRIAIVFSVFWGISLGLLINLLTKLFALRILSWGYSIRDYWQREIISNTWLYLLAVCIIVFTLIVRWRMRTYRLSTNRQSQDTSGNLGSARFATMSDIKKYDLRSNDGALIGKDQKGYIRFPELTDRLILAYRGGGKTSSLLIPLILDYMHVNKLITDVKGELAAVTARRAKNSGRDVFVLDPFHVLETLGVDIPTHGLNPLAYLSHFDKNDTVTRDRYIAAIAGALCSSDRGSKSETDRHFNENAHIILEGILDFYVEEFSSQPEAMHLVALHDWWLDMINDPDESSLKLMLQGSHRARAAASQLFSAGKNESGSMKTTVYRQLQWLRSEPIRQCFLKNDVDLDRFVSGQCDIYVVLPEDMVASYARMVRVVMALVKVKLIQTPIQQLKQDYCFVLDELGQFGYSPDVEQVINTMRARGVKVWASFQTMNQIEMYVDEAVFKDMPIKHFLGGDDIKTMKWIQELGGKTTVLTENLSRQSSYAIKGNQKSVSESRSVSETGTDLIHFDQMREIPADEQFVFIKGMRPIRCKKAFYFKESIYQGMFDENPLEQG